MSDIEKHNQALMQAMAAILNAEQAQREAESAAKKANLEHDALVHVADKALSDAWGVMQNLMKETGEVECVIPGNAVDYVVSYSTPRESVKVEDVDAVPEEFVKIERKPILKDIGEHLNKLRDIGVSLPNWAVFQLGESKLQWRTRKKEV